MVNLKFWTWGKKKEEPSLTVEEKVQDSAFKKVQSDLYRLKSRVIVIKANLRATKDKKAIMLSVKESEKQLKKIKKEFAVLKKEDQKNLSGLFKQIEDTLELILKKL